MASSSDVDLADRFDISGPAHMMKENGAGCSTMAINWDKEEHRRCVAACLVKGAYIMENDSNRRRVHTNALAPVWWESFGFHLLDVIKHDFIGVDDQFIVGAIYEHKTPSDEPRHPLSPHYVVVFRGTMTWHPKAIVDLYLDLQVILNTLPESKRFRLAKAAVQKLVATIDKGTGGCGHAAGGSCIVWLAGHSLGASLALEVGRTMMTEQGYNLPTFLFNPPQVSSAPVINALLPTEKGKRGIYAGSYFLKAGLGKVLKPYTERMEKLFEQLSPWVPELYVHEKDIICKGYIDYFEQRKQLQERFRGIAKSGKVSYRDMICSVFGKEKNQPHLLPSARLWKNTRMDGDPHALQQWWKPDGDLSMSAMRYGYP